MIFVRRALLSLVVLAFAACGGENAASGGPRPLTFEEATLLATAQSGNLQSGGALVEVSTAFTSSGESLVLRSEVDWAGHEGHAMVSAQGRDEGVVEVFWTESAVLERRPLLTSVLEGRGVEGVEWVAREPESEPRLLDRTLSILVGLASETPDNALLVQQQEGSAWLRNDTLRGREVTVLRYGERNVYWLDVETGAMLRFEGNAEGGAAPIVVDLLQRGPQEIVFPLASTVVEVSEIQDVYDVVTASP